MEKYYTVSAYRKGIRLVVSTLVCSILISMSHMGYAASGPVNYQSVVRDAEGDLLNNKEVTFRFVIRAGSENGSIVYEESHETTTNERGLVNLHIGKGTPVTGTYDGINWHEEAHYLDVELDVGDGFQKMGTQQFVSVPYAKYTELAGKVLEMNLEELDDVNIVDPETDQVLVWDGSSWSVANQETGIEYSEGSGIILEQDSIHARINEPLWNAYQLQSRDISESAPSTDDVLRWDGNEWAPAEMIGSEWERQGNFVYTDDDSIGIFTNTPRTALHVNSKNVLFGNMAEGNNTRMTWDQSTGSIRAGEALNYGWDPDSLGDNSVAFGSGTKATGSMSFAWGDGTLANDVTATAFGRNTVASGPRATAWGRETNASGIYSTAFGNHTVASGGNSTAFGQNTNATGTYSIAWGQNTNASGSSSTAFGNNTVADGINSLAAGRWLEANGNYSYVFGRGSSSISKLVNNNSSSLMVGFGTEPTLFVKHREVGINTESTSHNLHIYQTNLANRGIGLYHNDYPSSREWVIRNTASTSNDYLDFRHDGSLISYINASDGSYNILSDARLKENVKPLENALDRVLMLQPVNYQYIGRESDKPTTGLIAQDVLELFPQFVNKRKVEEGDDEAYYSISYSGFSVIAVRAIQEQQHIIEEQNQNIENQQKTITQQQKMLEQQQELLEQQQKAIEELTERMDDIAQE